MQPDTLSKELLEQSINELAKIYYNNSVHVLLLPDTYADRNSMEYEKKYSMWIYDAEYSDNYFKFLNRLLRFSQK